MEDKARTQAPMRTCAVAARKGGVGKTFASISLAVNAAFGGPDKKLPQLKVLFIDVDSQQNSTYFFLKHFGAKVVFEKVLLPKNPDCEDGNVYNITDVFMGNDFMEYPTQYENLMVLPSDGHIDNFNGLEFKVGEETVAMATSAQFKKLIKFVDEDYDLVIIDTPPSKTFAATGALAAASDCLVVGALDSWNSEVAIPGILSDIENNNQLFRDKNNPLNVVGILLNKLSSKKITNDEKKHLVKIRDNHREHLSSNLMLVDRVAFKTTVMPQDPLNYDYMKDKETAQQMRNFFYHFAQDVLKDIYADVGVDIDKFVKEQKGA